MTDDTTPEPAAELPEDVRVHGTVTFVGGPLDGTRDLVEPGFSDPLDTLDEAGNLVRYRLVSDRRYELDPTPLPTSTIDPAGDQPA